MKVIFQNIYTDKFIQHTFKIIWDEKVKNIEMKGEKLENLGQTVSPWKMLMNEHEESNTKQGQVLDGDQSYSYVLNEHPVSQVCSPLQPSMQLWGGGMPME